MADETILGMGVQALDTNQEIRDNIMDAVKDAIEASSDGDTGSVNFELQTSILQGIDIATGAGAMVMDDTLQKLSTGDQSAAQLVSASNKANKEVQNLMNR